MGIPAERIREESEVQVSAGEVTLQGNLTIPRAARGIVLFAHGSGSSRFSPRNRFVANTLVQGGLATLLFDLLTADEEEIDQWTRELRFDINLLAKRLAGATDWVLGYNPTRGLHIGYFGSSTGAAAALVAAADRPNAIAAIVSRGGRPDLAGVALNKVEAPTLLIVGENDLPVIELNQQVMHQIRTKAQLEIVPGATHLFEEHGALEEVARLAREWFQQYLGVPEEGG